MTWVISSIADAQQEALEWLRAGRSYTAAIAHELRSDEPDRADAESANGADGCRFAGHAE